MEPPGVDASGARKGNHPDFTPFAIAENPPPPVSGGTLAVLSDGRRAIASDPDRDQVYVVDLIRRELESTVALRRGDEPGRVAEDGDGRVHVVLRRAGSVLSFVPGFATSRHEVCSAPRGIAFDPARNLLHVACAGGELVSLRPADGSVVARIDLERDLRDVVVRGNRIFVSKFRTAEVLVVNGAGRIEERLHPPRTGSPTVSTAASPDGGAPADAGGRRDAGGPSPSSPAVAWRMVPGEAGQVVMVHQRGSDGDVGILPGSYGASCNSIVESAVTILATEGAVLAQASLPQLVLPVDVATSADFRRMAVVGPGNARVKGAPQVWVGRQSNAGGSGCVMPRNDPFDTSPPDPGFVDAIAPPSEFHQPLGEAVAIAFGARGNVIVQTREPAQIEILTLPGAPITLAASSRADTGHAVFHANAGGGVACASCHPEGGEDARVWRFAKIGARRTQSLRGGVLETAPFHWDGDMRDLSHLMTEVFSGRMSGPRLEGRQFDALARFVDQIPLLPAAPAKDMAAMDRGRRLFTSATVGCATCHTGPKLTNNQSADVGTGGMFQVPSLKGLLWRAPLMHNGCAATVTDRFSRCGGDERHGSVSKLAPTEIADLAVYLETL